MPSIGVGVTFDHQIEGSDDHEHGLDEVLNNGTLPVKKFRESISSIKGHCLPVHITAVAPPPMVKRAAMRRSMPMETYKSRLSESLMNRAPLNKSA